MRQLVLFLLALPPIGAATTDRTVDRWGVEEGLPNNALTDIIQTRDGYLWVATWARIVRFDGVRFTRLDGSSGNGFDNMRGRVRAVGGTLSVDSAAGRGTRLTFRLPLIVQ